MTSPRIELHIDEIVLHGVATGDRHAIAEDVQLELTRLLQERGVPSGLGRGARVGREDGESFRVSGAESTAMGVQVAEAIYRSLGRSGRDDAEPPGNPLM